MMALAVGLMACPTPAPTCSAQSCANGCCKADGTCSVAGSSAAACGLNGQACVACAGAQTCSASTGACVAGSGGGGGGGGSAGAGGGTAGSGGSAGAGGGTAGAGGTAGGGGTAGTGGSAGMDGGADSGTPDAGDPCMTVTLDALLGSLRLQDAGVIAASGGSVPAGVLGIGFGGGRAYTLSAVGVVSSHVAQRPLPAGTALGSLRAPADADGGTVFFGSFVAPSQGYVLGGYTRLSQAGVVTALAVDGGPALHADAPGVFTAVALPSGGWLLNSLGLQGVAYRGVAGYLLTLDGGAAIGAHAIAVDAGTGSSGFTAVTGSGDVAFGYYDQTQHVRVVPQAALRAAVGDGGQVQFSQASSLVAADDVFDVVGSPSSFYVVRGAWDGNFTRSWTTRVERFPVGDGGVGPARTVLSSPDECTSVLFSAATAQGVVLGVRDRNGARLVYLDEVP